MTDPRHTWVDTFSFCHDASRHGRARAGRAKGRAGYVLLETVIATGLLILGLAVIGVQVQSAQGSVRKMQLRARAMDLADMELSELDLGLVELDSLDQVQEEDFGPRYPDFGWSLTTEETAIDGMFMLRLEVLHHLREGDYVQDTFDFDLAEVIYTVHALRAIPPQLNLVEDFGLPEDQLEQFREVFAGLGDGTIDPESLSIGQIPLLPPEDLLKLLASLAEAGVINLNGLTGALPPELRSVLDSLGDLGDVLGGASGDGSGNGNGSGTGNSQSSGPRGGRGLRGGAGLQGGNGRTP